MSEKKQKKIIKQFFIKSISVDPSVFIEAPGKRLAEKSTSKCKSSLIPCCYLTPDICVLALETALKDLSQELDVADNKKVDPTVPSTEWKNHDFLELVKAHPTSPAAIFILEYLYLKLLREHCSVDGWCWINNLAPSKKLGYAQIKFQWCGHQINLMTCHNLSYIFYNRSTYKTMEGYQVSHLCNKANCIRPDHLVYENTVDNNRRKNCLVYIKCPHDQELHKGNNCYIWTCLHTPTCIKYHPLYTRDELKSHVCHWMKCI